jgi:hypothetical protein
MENKRKLVNKLKAGSCCERRSGKKIARRCYKTRVHIEQWKKHKICCNILGVLLVNDMSIVQKVTCHYQRQTGKEVLWNPWQKPSNITSTTKLGEKRLRWSRGSVLPFKYSSSQGFKPGRSHQDFPGRKNPQHAFLRKGSKAVGPMSQICGMWKIPGLTWKSQSQAKLPVNSRPHSSTFRY